MILAIKLIEIYERIPTLSLRRITGFHTRTLQCNVQAYFQRLLPFLHDDAR